MNNNTVFYIPIAYTLSTRIVSLKRFFSWIIIYVTPVIFIFTLYNSVGFLNNILISATSIILIYNNYELGYIFNDAEKIKREIKPTIRLNKCNLNYYESNKWNILTFRLSVSLLLSLFIYHACSSLLFILSAWTILLVFFIYNSINSRWNILFHLILVFLRYCSVAFLFSGLDINLLFLFVLFPLPNTIERSTEKKFQIPLLKSLKNIDKFRCYYHLLLFFVTLTFNLFFLPQLNIYMLAFSFYYLTYRTLIHLFNLRR